MWLLRVWKNRPCGKKKINLFIFCFYFQKLILTCRGNQIRCFVKVVTSNYCMQEINVGIGISEKMHFMSIHKCDGENRKLCTAKCEISYWRFLSKRWFCGCRVIYLVYSTVFSYRTCIFEYMTTLFFIFILFFSLQNKSLFNSFAIHFLSNIEDGFVRHIGCYLKGAFRFINLILIVCFHFFPWSMMQAKCLKLSKYSLDTKAKLPISHLLSDIIVPLGFKLPMFPSMYLSKSEWYKTIVKPSQVYYFATKLIYSPKHIKVKIKIM